jgi:hypothetical protein
MTRTETVDISSNMTLLEQLWPQANWNPALRSMWRDRLEGLNQNVVREALMLVRPMYTSRDPELKWVLAKCSELHDQRFPKFRSGENGSSTWHVSWQRTSKHGVPRSWYGRRCETREEAERLAKQMRGHATCMDPTEEPWDEIAARQEVVDARRVIADLPREKVADMVQRLRSIGFCTGQLPARVSDWPRLAVLAVAAELANQQERQS